MKKNLSILLIMCIAILVACNSESNEPKTATKAASFDLTKAKAFIDSINPKFSEAIIKGDSNWVASQYGPDAEILLAGSEPIKGKDILAMWGSVSRSNQKDWSFTTTDLQGDENFLIETGNFEIKDDNKKSVDHGEYVVVWKKQNDGSWKLYRDIGVSGPASK